MKTQNSFYLLCLVCIGTLFTSCMGNTDRVRVIHNNSIYTIQIQLTEADGSFEWWTIPSNQSEIISFETESGGTDEVENPAEDIRYIDIRNSSYDSCRKNYRIQSNWDIVVDQTKKTPCNYRHEYTFVVNDTDF